MTTCMSVAFDLHMSRGDTSNRCGKRQSHFSPLETDNMGSIFNGVTRLGLWLEPYSTGEPYYYYPEPCDSNCILNSERIMPVEIDSHTHTHAHTHSCSVEKVSLQTKVHHVIAENKRAW
jgi:hypothetical protein